jgi:hypothetical protein
VVDPKGDFCFVVRIAELQTSEAIRISLKIRKSVVELYRRLPKFVFGSLQTGPITAIRLIMTTIAVLRRSDRGQRWLRTSGDHARTDASQAHSVMWAGNLSRAATTKVPF